MRRGVVMLLLAAVTVGMFAHAAGAVSAGAPASRDVRRVLVISLPATSWSDIQSGDDPNLRKLFADSAIADMVTRVAGRKSSIAGGYTAFGAGGRASAVTPVAGQAFEATEPYGESTAGEVFRQRTGIDATSGIVHLGIEALIQENADGLYDPQLGALGDTLERAHVPSRGDRERRWRAARRRRSASRVSAFRGQRTHDERRSGAERRGE